MPSTLEAQMQFSRGWNHTFPYFCCTIPETGIEHLLDSVLDDREGVDLDSIETF